MPGNEQYPGAKRRPGSKKGPTKGSGGQRRKGLEGKGPTPRAENRVGHPKARAKARAEAGLGEMPDATQTDELGSRGGRVDGVPVHAVRLRGLTASEEILLGNAGEQLVIRTDSFDRVSFMPGVLLGVRRVSGRTGLTIGLDQVMGL